MLADDLDAAGCHVLLEDRGPRLAELRRRGRELHRQRLAGLVLAERAALGQLPASLVEQGAALLHAELIIRIGAAPCPVGLRDACVHPQFGLRRVIRIGVDRSDQLVAVGAVRDRLANLDVAQDRVRGREVLGRLLDDLLDFLGHDFLDFDLLLDDLRLDDLDLFLHNLGHDLLDDLGLRGRAGGQDHADDHEDAKQHRHLLQ